MLRMLLGVAVLLGAGGLLGAQDKGKKPEAPKTKAKLVEVDVKKSTLTVEMDSKKQKLDVGKEVKFLGPRGGKTDIKDKRLKAGIMLGLVFEGKKLKEVHIPVIPTKKDKGKEKDKK